MKFVLLVCLGCVFGLPVLAQNEDNSVRAFTNANKLEAIINEIVLLDKSPSDKQPYVCTYAFVDSRDYEMYQKRLKTVSNAIEAVESIGKEFDDMAKKSPGLRDYLIQGMYTRLVMLGIVSRVPDFIEYAKADKGMELLVKASPDRIFLNQEYSKLFDIWSKKSDAARREMKLLIKKITDIDKNDLDAAIGKSLLNFYENKNEMALKELKSTYDKVSRTNSGDFRKEKYQGFLKSWIGFLAFVEKDYSSFKNHLDTLREFSEPQATIAWADIVNESWRNHTVKGHELRNKSLELPQFIPQMTAKYVPQLVSKTPNLSITDRKLLWKNRVKVKFEKENVSVSLVPQELFRSVKAQWANLQRIELSTWTAALEGYQNKFKNPELFWANLEGLSGKDPIAAQKEKYYERFVQGYELVTKLTSIKRSWDEIISKNPEIPIYRQYRIKTNIALSYISQNRKTFLDVFTLLKQDFEFTNPADLTAIEEDFKHDVKNEIEADLKALETLSPNTISTLLTRAEVVTYILPPNEAMPLLDKISVALPKEATYSGFDAQAIMTMYRMYLQQRLGNYEELSKMVNILKPYPYLNRQITYAEELIKVNKGLSEPVAAK